MCMKKRLWAGLICLALSAAAVNAQNVETIYYDNDANVVSVKEFADYYRVVETGEQFPKMFRDYYVSGKPFRTGGKFVGTDAEGKMLMDGNITEYYENGDIARTCKYVQGKIEGLETVYKDGLKYEKNYENGVPDEDWWYVFDSEGNMSRMDDSGKTYYPSLDEKDSFILLSEGQFWQVYADGSLSVAAQLHPITEYGKYYRLDLYIRNGSLDNFEFDPSEVRMLQTSGAGTQSYAKSITANDFKNKIDKRNRTKGTFFAIAEGIAAAYSGQSYSTSASSDGTVTYSTTYRNTDALYAEQVARADVQAYTNRLAQAMAVISDSYLQSSELESGTYLSGYILFEREDIQNADVTVRFNDHDYIFHFEDLQDKEFGSWDVVKGSKEMGFALVLSPMISRYLESNGSTVEIKEYETALLNDLNSMQQAIHFKKDSARYAIVLEMVTADSDDAELRGWAYLYDTETSDKIASYRIKAEGRNASNFNLRLSRSLHNAAKKLVARLSSEGIGQ